MDLGLEDRVAIVGGSSRGIGRAIALAFAREGAKVAICARTEGDLRRTEIELARLGSQHHVLAIPADLGVARDIRRVVRDTVNRFGQVGILVTRIGAGPPGRPSEMDDETLTEAMEHNYLSAVRFGREVIPYMKRQRWGRIIHLLPTYGEQAADRFSPSLSAQMAVMGYSKTLANELASSNITVNNILAGPIKTGYFADSLQDQAEKLGRDPEELLQEATAGIPMKRLGKPEEVGDLVAFLASERSCFLTGTNVVIDGGKLQTLA
jgi:3-oxoacyl-[acyl-carrier protein] reductase